MIRIIRERGLKQKAAAELFGVSQPRTSDLVRGKIEALTLDSLVTMLAHAGVAVDLSVRTAGQARGPCSDVPIRAGT
ncbi:MAG: XRE family transcriptional regulator [Gemmatimonadetes bacterium]|nr:XRE family transcriptional regulator [Gemmatimonadota bacterium]